MTCVVQWRSERVERAVSSIWCAWASTSACRTTRDRLMARPRCSTRCGSPGILPPASQARRSRECGSPQPNAWRWAPTNGAKAMGIANKTGSLEFGKRADIILLRASDINMLPFHDGHSAVLHSANTSNVDTVIVDGKGSNLAAGFSASISTTCAARQWYRSIFCASVPAASGRRSLGKNARPRITADSSASSVVASIVPVAESKQPVDVAFPFVRLPVVRRDQTDTGRDIPFRSSLPALRAFDRAF